MIEKNQVTQFRFEGSKVWRLICEIELEKYLHFSIFLLSTLGVGTREGDRKCCLYEVDKKKSN